ncbi:carbonic anhydrase 4-like [Neoarius graeffei]|uniref:carbonic anhydrase 4-like n=1 Tax=Neoarius graeffei TaxID=443677 RepID=UPI00298D0AE4|nr:carbonic anhydrase 4-like [Neoarius graeffei]
MFTVSLVHLALRVIFIYNLLDLVEHEKCNNLEISVDDQTQCSKRKGWGEMCWQIIICLSLLAFFPPCYQSQMSCTQSCKGLAAWNEMTGTCGGNRQSPINIVTKKTKQDSSLTAFKFTDYDKTFNTMLKNTGETVSLDIPLGASVSGGNLSHTYNAFQLHFHWGNNGSSGSEHTLDGEQYPMELAAFSSLKFKDGKPMVDTFRPVQPRKGRVVYRSHSGVAGTAIMVSFTLVLLCVSASLSCYQFY